MKFACLSCWALLVAAGRCALGVEPNLDAHSDPLPNGAIQRLGTIRLRHGGMVHGAAFSSDGKYLATSGEDGPIRLWEPRTGKLIRHFRGPNQRVYGIAFSPDGKQLASTGGWPDQSLHIWNVETGAEIHRLGSRGLNGPWSVAWSPDGKLLASAHGQGEATIALWDAIAGKEVRRFRPSTSEAMSLVFTPDGKQLISGGSDGSVQLWEVATGKEIRLIARSKGWAFQVTLSPDGKSVAAAGNDMAVRLWDIETGKELQAFSRKPAPHFPGITGAVLFTRDGKKLITGGMDRIVHIWDLATGRELQSIDAGVPPLALSPDGKTLAMTGRDYSLRLWDMETGKQIPTPDGPCNEIYSLAVSPDGKTTALGVRDEFIRLYETASGKELRHWVGHEYGVHLLVFSPDGKNVLANSVGGAEFWDVSTGKSLGVLPRDFAFGAPAVYSPDGKWLAFRSVNCHVIIWDIAAAKQISRFGEEPGMVRSLCFAPDGKTLAVGSELREIALWDPATGKKKLAIKTPQLPQSVVYTPDGKSIAADSGEGGAIELRDAATGNLRYTVGGYPDYGGRLTISPDGRLLATTGAEKAVVVRELATGQVRRRMKGHIEQIAGLTFGPTSRMLVSASRDTTGLVWDAYSPLEGKPATLTTIWDDLGSSDAERAHAAMVAALKKPADAVAVLKEKLRPAEALKPEALQRLINQLVDDDPVVRERAATELVHLDELAAPALGRALENNPAPQLRTAIESVRERMAGAVTVPATLRILRAVEWLELAGTREARALLEDLARGAADARETRESRAALERKKRAK